jgi:hypothetical protein
VALGEGRLEGGIAWGAEHLGRCRDERAEGAVLALAPHLQMQSALGITARASGLMNFKFSNKRCTAMLAALS